QDVDLTQRDLDVVARRRVPVAQAFAVIRRLGLDVGGYGAPARQRLPPRVLRADRLERCHRRDGGQPAPARVRHAPQLEAADARGNRAFDRVAHDTVGDRLGPALDAVRVDAFELRQPGVFALLPARERRG